MRRLCSPISKVCSIKCRELNLHAFHYWSTKIWSIYIVVFIGQDLIFSPFKDAMDETRLSNVFYSKSNVLLVDSCASVNVYSNDSMRVSSSFIVTIIPNVPRYQCQRWNSQLQHIHSQPHKRKNCRGYAII